MQQSGYPTKFAAVWGVDAAGADITTPIPTTTSTAGRASLQQGFPPACFTPVSAGGTPPFGADFNGALSMLSAAAQADQAGATPLFDSTFVTEIGGYPKGCILASSATVGLFWVSTVDNNTTNPDGSSPSGWQSLFTGYVPYTAWQGNLAARGATSIRHMPDGTIVQRFPTPSLGSSGTAFSQQSYSFSFPIAFPNGVLDISANDGGYAGSIFNSFGNLTKTGGTGYWLCVQANVTGVQGAIVATGW